MRSSFLFSVALVVVLTPACSSSSSGNAGSDQNKGDAGADTNDATPPTDTGVAETVSLDDSAVDDTTTNADSAVDTSSSNKCAGVVCTGSYQACCPSTGLCYDTRYGTCY